MNPWEHYGMTEVEYLRMTNHALRMSRQYWYEAAQAARQIDIGVVNDDRDGKARLLPAARRRQAAVSA